LGEFSSLKSNVELEGINLPPAVIRELQLQEKLQRQREEARAKEDAEARNQKMLVAAMKSTKSMKVVSMDDDV
jgi:regulator of protease activity HflC (stomatin/prohibitin superfamily)